MLKQSSPAICPIWYWPGKQLVLTCFIVQQLLHGLAIPLVNSRYQDAEPHLDPIAHRLLDWNSLTILYGYSARMWRLTHASSIVRYDKSIIGSHQSVGCWEGTYVLGWVFYFDIVLIKSLVHIIIHKHHTCVLWSTASLHTDGGTV